MGRASVGDCRGKFRVFHSHYWYSCLVLLKVWVCSLFDQYDGDFIRDSYQACSLWTSCFGCLWMCIWSLWTQPPTSNKLLEAQVTNFDGFCIGALSITDSNLFLIKGQKVIGSTHNNGTLWNNTKLSCNRILRTINHSKHLHRCALGLWGLWSWTHLNKQTPIWNETFQSFETYLQLKKPSKNLLFVSLWSAWFFEGKTSNLSFIDKLPNIRNWWV
jgi:hypothetical protein